ncbi:MAG: sugar phosphate isomerase/epimerase [Gemmataceae bacterium]|nr:sugar phosphate isomerase/epimerase [Gemmataceae bacterium]
MNLAVSNIAWPREQDAAAAAVLRECGVTGIEVAPTKLWPNPLEATDAEIAACRGWWEERGLRVVAAQALLFGRPELKLFDSAEVRGRTQSYLSGIVRLCSRLGAEALVFGSPKNRQVGPRSKADVWSEAVAFFRRLADVAAAAGTVVVLEANPPEYGADFVTRAADAVQLVDALKHPGFRLHLDTGCMTLANDPIRATFDAGFPRLRHVHVSEPNLDPPGTSGRVDHAAFATELRRRGYAHWVSLEMREANPFDLGTFAAAVRWFADRYGGGGG